jgi:acetylornithine deacetylase/succinyl-diaminopimelate desuccinylase-like protein
MRIGALALLAVLSLPLGARAQELSPHQRLALEIYRELIEIDTTHDHGSTTRAAEAVRRRLLEGGFPADDVVLLEPAPAKGNLVARLRSGRPGKPILLLAHLDVVEAKREDWSVDPFTFLEQDGYYYGRGTSDDKAMASIFVANLLRLRRERTPLRRDIVLALTADEETGPDNGVEFLLREHRDLVDAALVINEGGGGRISDGRYLVHGVQAAEKLYRDFRLEVQNKGGHSSLPRPDNAIYQLAAALGRLERHTFPVELNPVTRSWLEKVAAVESRETAADMRALARNPKDAQAAARLSQTPAFGASLRTTCVATRIEGGHANNALPQQAAATINCRILPGHAPAEVLEQLREIVADPALQLREIDSTPAVPSPPSALEPEVLFAIESITQQMWPGVPVVPTMSTGATDSRFFRAAGIPAYGVSGIFSDLNDVRAHGRDERIGVKQYYEGLEFLDRLARELAGAR